MIFKNLWVWFVISLLCHKKVKQLLPLEHPNMIEYFQMCVLSTFCSLQRLDKIASETLTDAEMLWAAHRERKNCWNLHFLSFKCPQLLLCKAGQNLQISEKRPICAEKSWKYKFSDLILTPHNVTYFKIIKMCNLKTVMIAANYIELVILSKFPKIAHYDITCPLMLHATGSNLPGKWEYNHGPKDPT